jgi:hypothetical protein
MTTSTIIAHLRLVAPADDRLARQRSGKQQDHRHKDDEFEQLHAKESPRESGEVHAHGQGQDEHRGDVREDGATDDRRHRRMLGEAEPLQDREPEQRVRRDERTDEQRAVQIVARGAAEQDAGGERDEKRERAEGGRAIA